MIVSSPRGLAEVVAGKIVVVTSDEFRAEVVAALMQPQIEQFASMVDGESVEGVRAFKPHEPENDRLALERLPGAVVTDS